MQQKTLSRKIKDIGWSLLNAVNLGGSVELILTGALKDDGWFRSYKTKTSVDKDGNPIPWCTYPFIKFIEPRLKKTFNVFEYGSGNSTLWYAARVKTIKAVEHEKEWYDYVSTLLPSNAKAVYVELRDGGDYSKEVKKDNKKYNLVIVDGRDRNNCIQNSINALTDDGVIIFDNSDRPQYKDGIEMLIQNGFKRIDFIGLSPVTTHNCYTSVFYKANNCLGI